MNINKDFPKIPVRDWLGYKIINRYGEIDSNCAYIFEEVSLKRFSKPKKASKPNNK